MGREFAEQRAVPWFDLRSCSFVPTCQRQHMRAQRRSKRRVLHAAGAEPRAARAFAGEHGEHPPLTAASTPVGLAQGEAKAPSAAAPGPHCTP